MKKPPRPPFDEVIDLYKTIKRLRELSKAPRWCSQIQNQEKPTQRGQ